MNSGFFKFCLVYLDCQSEDKMRNGVQGIDVSGDGLGWEMP